VSTFCRHNRFTADCPICSKGTVLETGGQRTRRKSSGSPSKPAGGRRGSTPAFTGPHVAGPARRDEDDALFLIRLERVPGGVRLGEWRGSALVPQAPVLAALGDVTAGKQVVLVPGNHDHQLVAPALERGRLAGVGPLEVAGEHPPQPGDLAERVASLMPRSELTVSYPGVWLRDDVYATHGHYLDAHLTVPRVECLVAAAVERFGTRIGPDGPTSAAEYEAIFTPMYALSHAIAQNARARPVTRRNNLSRHVWSLATNGAEGGLGAQARGLLVGRAAIPAAVAAINAAGLGPFKAELSGAELRRAGLVAIGEVVDRLGVEAGHVIFGHTHRAGPLPGDSGEWLLPGGTQLTNTGSWVDEDVFLDGNGPANPYWPGRVAWLDESGPPRLAAALDEEDLAAARAVS